MPRREEKEKLKFLRQEILATDQRIIELVFRRTQISQEIGRVKNRLQLPIENLDREKFVEEAGLELAKSFNLDVKFITGFLKDLIKLCKEEQKIKKTELV